MLCCKSDQMQVDQQEKNKIIYYVKGNRLKHGGISTKLAKKEKVFRPAPNSMLATALKLQHN